MRECIARESRSRTCEHKTDRITPWIEAGQPQGPIAPEGVTGGLALQVVADGGIESDVQSAAEIQLQGAARGILATPRIPKACVAYRRIVGENA